MNDTLTTVDEQIRAFAAAVRAELSDLPVEDVDDLVEGLVGDLTDQAADSDDAFRLGDPAEYARELRTAAGLPERAAEQKRMPLRQRVSAAYAQARRSSAGEAFAGFLAAIRPAWWVLRGVALYGIIGNMLSLGPRTLSGKHSFESMLLAWILLMAIVFISIQWGRGVWVPKAMKRALNIVLSIIAVIVIPLGWASLTQPQHPVYVETFRPGGLQLDGIQISNLFVYDAEGTLIDGAQIFTSRGTPVNLYGEESADATDASPWGGWSDDGLVVPFIDPQNRPVWNMYPLHVAPLDETTGNADFDKITTPDPPFATAPSRVTPSATPSPTPIPEPTP